MPVFDTRMLTHTYRWIAGKISEILGSEDDVVIELVFNLLEGSRFVRHSCILSARAFTDLFLA